MLRIGLVIGALAIVVAAAIVVLLAFRPTTSVAATLDPGVRLECTGFDSEADCLHSGDALLADGPPSNTFEMEDLARVEIARPAFGDASTCETAWFIERYPEEAVWREAVPCERPG